MHEYIPDLRSMGEDEEESMEEEEGEEDWELDCVQSEKPFTITNYYEDTWAEEFFNRVHRLGN